MLRTFSIWKAYPPGEMTSSQSYASWRKGIPSPVRAIGSLAVSPQQMEWETEAKQTITKNTQNRSRIQRNGLETLVRQGNRQQRNNVTPLEKHVNITAPRHRLTKGGEIQLEEFRTHSLLHTLLQNQQSTNITADYSWQDYQT